MPRIFDNIDQKLLPALRETLGLSTNADFCVGYFNLRGWKRLDSHIEQWSGGPDQCCRLLVGMQRLPQEELREALSVSKDGGEIDNRTATQLKKHLAQEFRQQLTLGAPTNEDEKGLRRLASQIRAKKVVVKLFLRHPLHAKLYLLFRPDPNTPIVGYLGSSNLTLSGLSHQGELNVDVLDHDACRKLADWFNDRWNDRWCVDISSELVKIIDESWAREKPVPPYHIYLKMAYHLSQEARAGVKEFRIPSVFGKKLFKFQEAAVQIAAHHINKRGGVLIGDVVGLGKTLMATAVAKIVEDDLLLETLIICPKNLVEMWEDYRIEYHLNAKVLSITLAIRELPKLRRFRLVIIDESHNLRNRDGKRYRAIQDYLTTNNCKCILLSATPYNKTYLDLSNQLRLFVDPEEDIGIRPEQLLREMTEFEGEHQCSPRTLAAFEHSPHTDDWRELMRLYLVRRTRTFIRDNYAETDTDSRRQYLTYEDGTRSYFPERVPRTMRFALDDKDPADQYARLYSPKVVRAIDGLTLPRYGLWNYLAPTPKQPTSQKENKVIDDLSRAGKRLMGFCRTNLFKRLESGGHAFLKSVERHIVRNFVVLHAIENGYHVPIGRQDAALLDSQFHDDDSEGLFGDEDYRSQTDRFDKLTEQDFRDRASEIYDIYSSKFKKRFRWLRSELFVRDLVVDLETDAKALMGILARHGCWDSNNDTKLNALHDLLAEKHPDDKVLVFSQFADTVRYLDTQLKARGIRAIAGVTGDCENPTALAWRFSPVSNDKRNRIKREDELRVLIATDVLSEGQNLQDCCVVVNYDLPWAIIRLVQRVGRVDRIGQIADEITAYSFLPAEGVERIITLRGRVRDRLQQNAEVVGTDEAFFEDDDNEQAILDLYNEKAGILDDDPDTEVDLASHAFQIWQNAIKVDPQLEKIIPALPSVVYSTRPHTPTEDRPEGVLVYTRRGNNTDALAWLDRNRNSVTESQYTVLKAAQCSPDTPALPRHEKHHRLVRKALELVQKEGKLVGGQLGRPSGARRRTYERLKHYAKSLEGSLWKTEDLDKAIEDIYRRPLRPLAVDALNRQLRSKISDHDLAQLVIELRKEGRLVVAKDEEEQTPESRIICSMGLTANHEER